MFEIYKITILLLLNALLEIKSCDFKVIDGFDIIPEEFYANYVSKGTPLLIKNAMSFKNKTLWPSLHNWDINTLKDEFKDTKFRYGQGPYPHNEITINEFVNLIETSNQTKSIFQYGQVPTSWSIWAHYKRCIPRISFFHPNSQSIHEDLSLFCNKILSQIEVPRFLSGQTNSKPPPIMITHSGFLIGSTNSGIDFHKHQDAINLVFAGEKRWFIKLPKASISFNEFHSSCNNIDEEDELVKEVCLGNIGTMARILSEVEIKEEEEENILLTCIQKKGDIVYIPEDYQHAVINKELTVAMQMQWYRGDFENFEMRRYLQQHLLNDLDSDKFRNPDDYETFEEFLIEQGWLV